MAITPLPPAPLPSDTPSEFNVKAFDLVAALDDFVTETNATAVAVDADATSADADAATATTKANEASASADLAEDWATKTSGTVDGTEFSAKKYAQDSSDSADASAASAVEAAGLVENYQGALASDPSLNKDGGALQAGDWYVNTATGLIRAYTGSVWVTSVNVTAGVSSFSAGTTGFTPSTGTQGNVTLSGTLGVANGGTGLTSPGTSGNVLTSTGTGWTSAAPPSSAVNYPQNIKSTDYTLVLSDAGKQIFHPASDTAVRTYTIPSNASVAFPIGTVILFVAEFGSAFGVNVTINSDTLATTQGITGIAGVPPGNYLIAIKTTATKWVCSLAFGSVQADLTPYSIAVAHSGTPFITAYPWGGAGFGTKFANPGTLPTGMGYGVAFSPSGNQIALAHDSTPFITAYPWSTSGFGTKYANPAELPTGTGLSVAFSPSGNAIAVGHNNAPYASVYSWSTSGFGSKFANPSTLPIALCLGAAFSPAGTEIAFAEGGAGPVAYPWSGSGFGTKFTDPATMPGEAGNGVAFSPSGSHLALAHTGSPFISVYPWSTSGFGVRLANPTTIPTGAGRSVAFSPNGNQIAIAHSSLPCISVYAWTGSGFGTKFSDPATLPVSNGNSVAFSPNGTTIAVACAGTPFIFAYPWSASGFGTKFANPATLPSNTGNGVAFGLI